MRATCGGTAAAARVIGLLDGRVATRDPGAAGVFKMVKCGGIAASMRSHAQVHNHPRNRK